MSISLRRRYIAKQNELETLVQMSPPELADYYRYMQKGLAASFFLDKYEEKHLNITRSDYCKSEDPTRRIKGYGFRHGYRINLLKKASPGRPNLGGRVLEPVTTSEWVIDSLQRIADHIGVGRADVVRAALTWYINNQNEKFGFPSFLDRIEQDHFKPLNKE